MFLGHQYFFCFFFRPQSTCKSQLGLRAYNIRLGMRCSIENKTFGFSFYLNMSHLFFSCTYRLHNFHPNCLKRYPIDEVGARWPLAHPLSSYPLPRVHIIICPSGHKQWLEVEVKLQLLIYLLYFRLFLPRLKVFVYGVWDVLWTWSVGQAEPFWMRAWDLASVCREHGTGFGYNLLYLFCFL